MNAPPIEVIVLAAGQGKRMHQAFPGIPKVLVPLAGRPMIDHLLDAVAEAGVSSRITVVVGPAVEEKVRAALSGRDVRFAIQPEPKGTGHAVLCARPAVPDAEHVLVVYGDHPLYSARLLRRLVERHVASGADMTMLTVPLPDFADWRSSFADWGRVVRDAAGHLDRIVEAKDATASELRITEVNPSMFCFRSAWLWEHLPQVSCENAQGEYYLTDMLGLAVSGGARLADVPADDAREVLGANTPEQLTVLERIHKELHP